MQVAVNLLGVFGFASRGRCRSGRIVWRRSGRRGAMGGRLRWRLSRPAFRIPWRTHRGLGARGSIRRRWIFPVPAGAGRKAGHLFGLGPDASGSAIREEFHMDNAGIAADGAVFFVLLLHAVGWVQRNNDPLATVGAEIHTFVQGTAAFLFRFRHVLILGTRRQRLSSRAGRGRHCFEPIRTSPG